MSADFLLELGTEELPPKNLRRLMQALRDNIIAGLERHELGFGEVHAYATPRRLAVLVEQLAHQTPQKELTVWGPPAKIAFDESGAATKAAQAFAQKNGVPVSELQTGHDGKADKLLVRQRVGGQPCTELLGDIVNNALSQLPIAKRMRWGAHRAEFVRPAHWLLMLYGHEIVDAEVFGLRANRCTWGHRFHYNREIVLDAPSEYLDKLKGTGFVLADIDARRALIRQQVDTEAGKVGGRAVIDRDLLDEVTALVEWPVALLGNFEKRFLNVPAEALIASMKEHQKYFHLMDSRDRLLPHFITVANIDSKDATHVVDGNERVIRPRLADAAFFFDSDKQRSLESLRDRLKAIVFQVQLGTVYQKTERVAALAAAIAGQLNADVELARRAGQLCKSDLVTHMVSEFDHMQGIAGYYYALNDGEPTEVAKALDEQYRPRFAGDALPETMTGTILALADRLDTIAGIFGIGQPPTGSKDPFALRRASLGVLRLLVDKQLDLDLRALLTQAVGQHTGLTVGDELVEQVLAYMLERFRAWYEEANIPAEVFQAVSVKGVSRPLDIDLRVRAVYQFSQMPQAQSLAAANKRVSNILAKSGAPTAPLEQSLLLEPAEQALADAVQAKAQQVQPLFKARDYARALESLADLQAPVDAFFDQVMVMTDDAALQTNRLALLQQLRDLFLQVADISLLVPTKG